MAHNKSLTELLSLAEISDFPSIDLHYKRKGINFSVCKIEDNVWILKVVGKGVTWSKRFTDYKEIFNYKIPQGIFPSEYFSGIIPASHVWIK